MPNMALRLSGQLLLGVSKIYDRKARYLLEDCSDAVFKIKTVFKPGTQVDLPAEQSKAAVAAITLTTTMNMDDLMMPELELNLDDILREATTVQQNGKATTLNTKLDLKKALAMPSAEESGYAGFGAIKDLNEIPGEFDMDIELGRRATGGTNPLMSDPLSIEQGRRESFVRESEKFDPMQFSPLRTPTKDINNANPFENDAPMMDDEYGAFNQDAEDMNPENLQAHSDPVLPEAMSPVTERIIETASPKAAPRQPRQKKKGSLQLDEQIQISHNELQANIRDTEDICEDHSELSFEQSQFVKTKSPFDLPIFAAELNEVVFSSLFTNSRPTAAATRASRRKQIEEVEEERFQEEENNAPMMDDDYGFMQPDDEQQQPFLDTENQVPDLNGQLSGLQSPMKRSSSPHLSQSSQSAAFSRSTLDTLEVWKSEFSSAKGKSLSLESDLMAAMAGQGIINKRVASSAFFEALVLRGKGLIQVRQDKPFAPITVQAKPGLFTAVLTE